MTLARTALRLAAVQSLKGAQDARPTLAQGRVFDSRISDISPDEFGDDAKPIVIVLTDGEEGEQLSKQNGGPPFRRIIDLVLELAMVQCVKDGDEFVIGYPDTDARHEASLDFLEYQIMQALNVATSPMPIVFRKMARIVKEDSHRQVTDDAGVKVACRILTLACDTVDDKVQPFPSGGVPDGMARLPTPLRWVAEVMPANTSGADVIAAIIEAISPLEVAPLAGLNITADANASADDPDNHGDDEVKANVDLPANTPTQEG